MLRHLRIHCPICRHDLPGRPELLGRPVSCPSCGHLCSVPTGDGASLASTLTIPREQISKDEASALLDSHTLPEVPASADRGEQEARAVPREAPSPWRRLTPEQRAQLEDEVRVIQEQLDRAREQSRCFQERRQELEDARAELDRLRCDLSRLRSRAEEADRLEAELGEERARIEQFQIELRDLRIAVDPLDLGASGDLAPPDGKQGFHPEQPWLTPVRASEEATVGPGDLVLGPGRAHPPQADGRDPEGDGRTSGVPEIAGYEILGTIRDGAMGTVLKARQLSVDRIVAIKILRDVFVQNEEYVQRFRREAMIAAMLSHPNIAAAIDAGSCGGRPYLVMEHVEGETIQEHLDKQLIHDEKTATRIVLALAEALRHIHQRGLIHRDIKPANVILTTEGGVKLTDMGLARPTGDEDWALAEAGTAVGTPEYISPEQIRGQTDVDIRSDLYSLGATLYHMVTGRAPYGGDTVSESMRRHIDPKTALVPPGSINPELSSSLNAVVKKLLAKNRCDRYQNPEELILDLERMQQGQLPLLAEPAPDVLAVLAVGDSTPGDSGSEDESLAESVSVNAGDDRLWNLLFVVPALLLTLSLVITIGILAAH